MNLKLPVRADTARTHGYCTHGYCTHGYYTLMDTAHISLEKANTSVHIMFWHGCADLKTFASLEQSIRHRVSGLAMLRRRVGVLLVPGWRQSLLGVRWAQTTGMLAGPEASLPACCGESRCGPCRNQVRACGAARPGPTPESQACAWVPPARCAAPDSTSPVWLA